MDWEPRDVKDSEIRLAAEYAAHFYSQQNHQEFQDILVEVVNAYKKVRHRSFAVKHALKGDWSALCSLNMTSGYGRLKPGLDLSEYLRKNSINGSVTGDYRESAQYGNTSKFSLIDNDLPLYISFYLAMPFPDVQFYCCLRYLEL